MPEPRDEAVKSLAGSVALVTGAGQGIGRGCALALAEAGAAVAVNDIDSGLAGSVVREVEALGARGMAVPADVTDRSQMNGVFDSIERKLGAADIIISNAGWSIRRPLLETTDDHLRQTLDVIVFGTFHTFQEAARRLIAAGRGGSMVTIGSVHVQIPFRNSVTYNTAKAALHNMARSFAAELVEHGIRVNVIVPGLTDTPGERRFRTDEELAAAASSLPMGRMASPEEVGRFVRFMVSPESAYMTGSIVTVDGGIGVSLSAGLRSQPGG